MANLEVARRDGRLFAVDLAAFAVVGGDADESRRQLRRLAQGAATEAVREWARQLEAKL